jgi:hypothetical protein
MNPKPDTFSPGPNPTLNPTGETVLAEIKQAAASLTRPFSNLNSTTDYAGKHSFINASAKTTVKEVFRFFKDYEQPHTSAVLLVPDWPTARFNHCLKGGQLLHQYPGGLLEKYPLKLIYMPPSKIHLSALADSPLTMTFRGTAAGYPATVIRH